MNRCGSKGWLVFHGLSSFIALGVVGAALACPLLGSSPCRQELSGKFARICHQIPVRCFHIGDESMPLCARCLGMWLGQGLGALAGLIGGRRIRWIASRGVVLVGVCMLSWLASHYGFPMTSNLERLVSGTLGGVGTYILTTCLLTELFRRAAAFRTSVHSQME
jgi:uncharacterized membrane protein